MVFVLLSPAKTLAFDRNRPALKAHAPHFRDDAVTIAETMKRLSPAKIGKLMHLSEKLATLNAERYRAFAANPAPDQTDHAILAFRGDTYIGFDAKTLSDAQLQSAHERVGILSGLYGLLQPLDAMQPYRLEMGTSIAIHDAKNLYAYWGERITKRINTLVKKHGHSAVIGCASNEYLSSVALEKLSVPFIQCDFKEIKNGKAQIVGLYAKRARGMMARYIVEHDVKTPAALKKFNAGGYAFDKDSSTETHFIFTR